MKLYVGNLPFTVQAKDLVDFFSNYSIGEDDVQLIKDRQTGKFKGFGFVKINNDTEAANAIRELNGKDFGGRAVIVNEARPRENHDRSYDRRNR